MDISSIERYLLQPYKIYGRASTTVSYAFASAVATREPFDVERAELAMVELGQDPAQLRCVFCDEEATSWDHLNGMVKDGEFSGYGHVLGNLVPACSRCNSLKGNKPWRTFVKAQAAPDRVQLVTELLEAHERRHLGEIPDLTALAPREMAEYEELRTQIFELMRRADGVARTVRSKTLATLWPNVPTERKSVRAPAAGQVPEAMYSDLYAAIFERVTLPGLRLPTLQNRSWQPFRSGNWGQFWIWLTQSELRVIAYLSTGLPVDKARFNKKLFDSLHADEPAIALEVGDAAGEIVWDRLDGKQASWMGFVRPRPDLGDDLDDSEDAEWAAKRIDVLVPAVEQRIRALVPQVLERL